MKQSAMRQTLIFVSLLFSFIFIFSPITAEAKRGCCSHHQGVKSCNNNMSVCNDGTQSKCPCDSTKTTSSTTSSSSSTTKTQTMSNDSQSNKTTMDNSKAPQTMDSMKGCCRGHGGVTKKCDKTTGNVICKDKSVSPGCACNS